MQGLSTCKHASNWSCDMVKYEAQGTDNVFTSSHRGSAVDPYALIDRRARSREQSHAHSMSISFDEA